MTCASVAIGSSSTATAWAKRFSACYPDGGRVDLRLYAEGTNAVLRVEDTGPGIGEADLPRFSSRSTVAGAAKGEGTGLGLSIVDRIVKDVSGSVAVENISATVGPGLRVAVTIPLAKVAATACCQKGKAASV